MDSMNDLSKDLATCKDTNDPAKLPDSELEKESDKPLEDDLEESKSQEDDSDTEWETQSESEWTDCESEWSESESEWSDLFETDSEDSGEEHATKEYVVSSPSLKQWGDDVRTAKVCEFKLKPGLKITCGKSPVDFYKLLFTRSLFEFLVNNINDYARKAPQHHQDGTPWTEVTVKEFHVFLGLFINIGTRQSNIMDDYWKKALVVNPEEYMINERFRVLLKYLNFDHAIPENNDNMSKISHMIDYFNITMKKVVNPERILCIEESIHVPCHEHVYLLTDQFGLAHKLIVQKSDDKAGPSVAKSLLEDKLDIGHSVYMENVFNTLELTKFLIDRNTHVTGTFKPKRLGNLKELIGEQLENGEKISKYNSDGISITKWKHRREVVMISSEHSGELQEYINKQKQTSMQPACVLEYKTYKNGVEKYDKMMSQYYYLWGLKKNKYKRIGVHILQMLLLNAYLLYSKHGERPMTLLDFRTVITKHLLSLCTRTVRR